MRQTAIADTITKVTIFFISTEESFIIVDTPKYFMFRQHKNITRECDDLGMNPLKNIKENVDFAGIEMFGNKRMIIFDCKSVIDFSEDCIVLCLGELSLKIKGDGLVISSFAYGQTDVTGEIVSVEFERV